ncbi:MAG: primosomal protein N' [Candidatus Saccharimonadales bacterium]
MYFESRAHAGQILAAELFERYRYENCAVIEVGKKNLTGVVLRQTAKPSFPAKSVSSIIEPTALPEQLLRLAIWMSEYYATPLATTLQTILPRGLTTTRRAKKEVARTSLRERTNIVFNDAQQSAIATVESMSPGTALLHGVTGSGKTRVYIELAQRALDRGKSTIVLVPEIALTSQLVDEFSHHFSDIILTHSRQTEAQRHIAWRDALTSTEPRIIVGPRSALFLPIHNFGLVVIDEAHEPSFKQEQSPRYSALRAASILAHHHRAKVILGSATPAISDYYLALHAKRPIITMAKRAKQAAIPPDITLIDMTKRANFKKHRFLSDALITQLTKTFEQGHQALIFHNRRGSASTTLCENCGWSAMCPQCFIPLTLHNDKHHLRCHACALTDRVPTSCPECHSADIIHKGIGTKLIESELRKLFPDKKIMRFDGDSEAGESVEQQYNSLYDGTIDMIIGTQVIAKGLDLPLLRTVGVIQADSGLSLPDFGSSERTFQLLAQVIGRVGRSHHPTSVIVQSYQPTHPAVVDGLAQDYHHFYNAALLQRQKGHFPPFTYLLQLTCIYKTEAAAIKNAKKVMQALREQAPDNVQIMGPTPAFYERQRDTYRWQLTLKSPKRQALVELLRHVPPTHWQSELDPVSLL